MLWFFVPYRLWQAATSVHTHRIRLLLFVYPLHGADKFSMDIVHFYRELSQRDPSTWSVLAHTHSLQRLIGRFCFVFCVHSPITLSTHYDYVKTLCFSVFGRKRVCMGCVA